MNWSALLITLGIGLAIFAWLTSAEADNERIPAITLLIAIVLFSVGVGLMK